MTIPADSAPQKPSSPDRTDEQIKRRLTTITLVACLGGLLFGYDTGVINGALEPMKQSLHMTSFIEGLVVSILIFGASIGGMTGGYLSDHLGRRTNILLLSIIFSIGTLGCVLSPNWQVLVIFRFVLGLAVGGASATVPIYLAELSPADKRGSMVTKNEYMIVFGQFSAFVINALIFYFFGHNEHIWRFMLLIALAPAIALFFGMLKLPESPRWLSMQGQKKEAFEVLREIRSVRHARKEMREVNQALSEEKKRQLEQDDGFFSDFSLKWVRRLIIIGIGIGIFCQLSGVNAVMYYGTQLLQGAGFSSTSAVIANILNGAAGISSITMGILIINKVDRRMIQIVGFVIIAFIHLMIGSCALMVPDSDPLKAWLILGLVACFVFTVQGTVAPLAWLLLSEIFPLRIRSLGMGISVFTLWISNALVAFLFPPLVASIGIALTFFIFAGFAVIAILFSAYLIPETRGISLEEFERQFKLEVGK